MAGLGCSLAAETCTTQSQMDPGVRDALAGAARTLASKVQAGDLAAVQTLTIAEYAKDFGGLAGTIRILAPKLAGGTAEVEQVYLLDASTLKKSADGPDPSAEFFCPLNRSPDSAEFSISPLPPGRYGFAMVTVAGAKPWQLSFLLRQDRGAWLLAGFYPRALTAGGHDGLWYWTEARTLAAAKQPWAAWLDYQEAQTLLRPAGFVSSTHLEKLRMELAAAAPPAVAQGIGPEAPLVVKAADGTEYRFTEMSVDNSLELDRIDVAVRLKVESLGDAAAARRRNVAAMSALLAAYPELRRPFHGVWVFAEAPGQNPYATELSMSEIP
jgi:hypothetical protein